MTNTNDAAVQAASTSTPSGDTSGTTQPAAQPEFTPIATQDDLNKVISQRLERERSKFADYADLKTKAEQFDQLEEAKKDEIQRATDRATTTEKERDDARAETSRLRVALKHGLSEDDAALLDDLRDEESMNRLAERLAKQAGEAKPSVGFRVDHSSTQTNQPPNKDDQARSFFGI